MSSLKASKRGQAEIRQARENKGWTVGVNDTLPLREASLFLLKQHALEKGWDANDPGWVREFDRLFRTDRHQDIGEIKIKFIQSRQGSLFQKIAQLINEGEILAKGISYGTWNRFASQTNIRSVEARAFKAYCGALGLDWEKIVELPPESITIPQKECELYVNLPTRNHSTFIGREKEMSKLLELLSPSHPTSRIGIVGVGGLGKTTLVLEAAYRCLAARQDDRTAFFEAIIFISAKPNYLTNNGILQRLNPERTLRDIFRSIARTLDCFDIIRAEFDEQLERIRDRLNRQRTLLIIDNLETIEEQENILSFLQDIPSTTKAIITSRVRSSFVSIHLDCLSLEESLCLIQREAEEKNAIVSEEEAFELYRSTGGLPMAIVYAIGQLASGYLLKNILTRLSLATGDVAHFCFESSIESLRGQLAHRLLMGLALFPKPALVETLIRVAGSKADVKDVENSLVQLYQLSLIKYRDSRYEMLSLTRGYVIAELQNNPSFEQEARERWVSWYLEYSQLHGGKDWKEWNDYGDLESEWENLQEAIEWCIAKKRYADFIQFWQQVKCYSHAQGYNRDRLTYWDTRLDWTDWLIREALEREDRSNAVEAMSDRGWTLTLLSQKRHLKEANYLLEEAWKLRYYKDRTFQIDLAINIAVLHLHQQQFDRAKVWLNETTKFLLEGETPDRTKLRQWVHIFYYSGETYFRTGEYDRAKIFFQKALLEARAIGWQRAAYCAQNWLADIAVEQGNLDEARLILEENLRVAEQNKDKSRAAFTKQSMAFLEKAHANLIEAYRWANLAQEDFLNLGMLPEVEAIDSFLQELGLSA